MAVGLGCFGPEVSKQVADHKSAVTISTVIAVWPLDSRVTNLSESCTTKYNKCTFGSNRVPLVTIRHYHNPGHQELSTPSSNFHFCHSTSPARMEIAPPPCNSRGHEMSAIQWQVTRSFQTIPTAPQHTHKGLDLVENTSILLAGVATLQNNTKYGI